jgi:hypothetical protein
MLQEGRRLDESSTCRYPMDEVIWHRLWKSHPCGPMSRCASGRPLDLRLSVLLARLGHRLCISFAGVLPRGRYTVPNADIKNWARDPDPETLCIVLSPTAPKCFRRSPGPLSDYGLDAHTAQRPLPRAILYSNKDPSTYPLFFTTLFKPLPGRRCSLFSLHPRYPHNSCRHIFL